MGKQEGKRGELGNDTNLPKSFSAVRGGSGGKEEFDRKVRCVRRVICSMKLSFFISLWRSGETEPTCTETKY